MLSLSQRNVESLVEKGYSVFVTGKASSGKSFFLRKIIDNLRQRGDCCCFVTAPTGIASVNIGGCTIHSFAGIGTGSKGAHELIATISSNKDALQRWQQCTILIIDEVSMLSRELFEKLEMIARCLKCNTKPFGGIQLILSGDFFQLKPVVKSPLSDADVYCFCSPLWDSCVDVSVSFTENYRQSEVELIHILDDYRRCELSPLSQHLTKHILTHTLKCNPLDVVKLYSHRDSVSEANDECLALLPGEPHQYISKDSGETLELKSCSAPKNVILKAKARVVLLKNMSPSLVNGLRGTISSFLYGYPCVIFDNGQLEVIREELFFC